MVLLNVTEQQIKPDHLKLTWDDLRGRASEQTELSGDKRRDAVAAFDTLQRIFGNSFLQKDHSLFFHFFDRSPWRCEWAIWFAGFISSLEKHPDFSRLVHELKNPRFFGERMTILEIVEILLSVGFIFRLDSPININGVPKKPDILVQLEPADPGFFIEVTTLRPSQKQWEADKAFDELWGYRSMVFPLERCAGLLERTPTSFELQKIKQQVHATIWKAENETGFETLEVPGLIKFAYARDLNSQDLEQWATAHGLKAAQLSMAGPDVDEFNRIARKLREKIRQVPSDRANVIVIYPHLFAMPPRDSAEFSGFVNVLEATVRKHVHIGYVIIIFTWTGGNDNAVIRFGDHICVNRRWLYFNCNSMMLIKNRNAAKLMSPATEERFLRAFIESF
jgi:hypothetical protein